MSEVKAFKKGDFLFKEGDKISHLFLIQSGSVTQCLVKDKKIIDLAQLGPTQILGESGLWTQAVHLTSAMATTETKVIPLPLEAIKNQLETLPQIFKYLTKSLSERLKSFTQEIKGIKIEKNGVPCPEENIPKLFAALYFASLHKGIKDTSNEAIQVDWPNFKTYLHKIFSEQPKRAEGAVFILKKLNLAELEYGKPEEDPEGLDTLLLVTFKKPHLLEAFFEFYQYFYFKPGKSDILKYDDFFSQIIEIFLEESEGKPLDRFGAVQISFQKSGEKIKNKMNIQLNNDHFARLESKGVLCKRVTREAEPLIEFSKNEIENIYFSWKIIREIDKWNQKGFVDINESSNASPGSHQSLCPQCQTEFNESHKFCSSCGFKLESNLKKSA